MKVILSISNALDNIVKKIISVLLMLMTVVLFSQVIARYVMGTGLSWSEELVRYICIWLVYLGTTCATKDGSQIAVTALEEALPISSKRVLSIIQSIITAAYIILLFWIGYKILGVAQMQKSPNMAIPMNIIYMVFPISMVIMMIHLIAVFFERSIAVKESHE